MSAERCPACGDGRSPLWWSKAGMTYRLCDACKGIARSQRRSARRSLAGKERGE